MLVVLPCCVLLPIFVYINNHTLVLSISSIGDLLPFLGRSANKVNSLKHSWEVGDWKKMYIFDSGMMMMMQPGGMGLGFFQEETQNQNFHINTYNCNNTANNKLLLPNITGESMVISSFFHGVFYRCYT